MDLLLVHIVLREAEIPKQQETNKNKTDIHSHEDLHEDSTKSPFFFKVTLLFLPCYSLIASRVCTYRSHLSAKLYCFVSFCIGVCYRWRQRVVVCLL